MNTFLFILAGLFAIGAAGAVGLFVVVIPSIKAAAPFFEQGRSGTGGVITFVLAAILGLVWATGALMLIRKGLQLLDVADWSVWALGSILAVAPILFFIDAVTRGRFNPPRAAFLAMGWSNIVVVIGFVTMIFWK